MARPLATPPPLHVLAAAAAAWLAAGAALVAMPVVPVRLATVRPVAAHASAAPAAWDGADRVYEVVDVRARRVGRDERTRIARAILEEAARARLAPLLVVAVIEVESGFDPRAVSPVGAVGLMQLMIPTLREVAGRADPLDPVANVRAGVRYLGQLVSSFSDVELALVAYNAGPNRIRRHLGDGGVPSRLLGYPRDVLRTLERLAPQARRPAPRALRPALARAHPVRPADPAPARGAVRPVASPPADGAASPDVLAALEAGAPYAGESLAALPSVPAGREEAAGDAPAPAPARAAPARDACVRLEPALPMGGGRDRARPVERPLPC